MRSPTAERVFSDWPGFEVASAGVDPSAAVPASEKLLQWADVIFVMEPVHQDELGNRFGRYLKGKRIVCLDIPDLYAYMDPALVHLLESKVTPFFRQE